MNTETEISRFQKHAPQLTEALSGALKSAVKTLGFDLRCLDWFSYNADEHISKKDKKNGSM